MITAFEYRQYARECMDGARAAKSAPSRNQFLELAKLWLAAAARMDGLESSKPPIKSNGDGRIPADVGAANPHEQS